MTAFLRRMGLCPLLFLLLAKHCIAVDPIDFLESLKDDEEPSPKDGSSTEYPNGVNVIPGEAEVNYPVYSSIPKSSFSCIGRPVGFYADTELRCQVWHICDEESRQQSFLCTNGTVYSQDKRVCDWWYNVNCDPSEVSRNYEQNYELYKGPPPKPDNDQGQENKINDNYNKKKNVNDFDEYKSSTTKAASREPFYNQPTSPRQNFERNNNRNDQQYSKPTPSYDDPSTRRDSSFSNNNDDYVPSASRRQPLPQSRPTTTTTTYRPPTTYSTPPPPAALQGNPFSSPPRNSPSRQQSSSPPQQKPTQSSFPYPPPPPPGSPGRSQPSIKTSSANGKRIVEIRVPISQIPPEILAKYGKRIPEHILKEIFLNFTRGQQKELQQEAIKSANPTGAGNSRSAPPKAPIPQSQPQQSQSQPAPRSQNKRPAPVDFGPPPSSSQSSNGVKSDISNNNKNSPPPPPPPPPAEPQQKFRHSTPRKVDGVKFAAPTRELLADYDDERQQVGESQNPIYSYQQLFNGHHRTSGKSQRIKESFTEPPPTTTTTTKAPFSQHPQQPYQDFSRAQPRRRTQVQTTSTARYVPTTEEPQLITDRYFPVSTKEEKMKAEVRRIFLIAKQGISVLPPIPVLSGSAAREESFPPQPTPRRFPDVTRRPQVHRQTTTEAFKKIPPPPPPKVAIPDDYYVKNERFQEAESRYPTPSIPPTYIEPYSQPRQRSTTTTTTTTTTTQPPPPPTPYYQEPEFYRRDRKPNKPQQQNKKKVTTPAPEEKKDTYSDYDGDGSPSERVNTDELELLRLAQEYIELTGQEFGVKQKRSE